MGGLSIWHWLIVLVVVLVLFGRGRISETMGDFGKGIKSFKEGMNDADKNASTPPAAAPQIPPAQIPQAHSSEQPVEGERTGSGDAPKS
ncbi:MAG: twin-arginine translocase TatA/TatE family subunit [Candidatus Andeanibacterium colombiense]|uniref:Sec-independent protein translocase protein TatA n=1 Tax=Candidatus Andeanibacterium colombiense TaxID=3121345 RepID=A0AAJ6BQU2_9SPHN|nr:MAG: twin-arginine translocase TatA/TatE family subunit [Sphingomonadaceae bacterium]